MYIYTRPIQSSRLAALAVGGYGCWILTLVLILVYLHNSNGHAGMLRYPHPRVFVFWLGLGLGGVICKSEATRLMRWKMRIVDVLMWMCKPVVLVWVSGVLRFSTHLRTASCSCILHLLHLLHLAFQLLPRLPATPPCISATAPPGSTYYGNANAAFVYID